jgi:hypothetical protein
MANLTEIEKMIEASKKKVQSKTTDAPSGGSAQTGEIEEVTLTVQNHSHVKGSGESGSELSSKKIRIDGKEYIVEKHLVGQDKETLILSRPTKATITSLGYEDIDQVTIDQYERRILDQYLKSHVGKVIDMAIADHDNFLKEIEVYIKGLDWDQPGNLEVIYYIDGDEIEDSANKEDIMQGVKILWEWQREAAAEINDDKMSFDSSEDLDTDDDFLSHIMGDSSKYVFIRSKGIL